jgi:hypothetical protein
MGKHKKGIESSLFVSTADRITVASIPRSMRHE